MFALGLKSTYVELAALVTAPVVFVRGRRQASIAGCGITFAAVLLLSMASHVSIGVRYVLVLIPLAMMAAAWWVFLPGAGPVITIAVPIVAVAVQAASAVAASPQYLSYFNGLAGGSMNG